MKNRYEAVITITVSFRATEGDEGRQLDYIEDALLARKFGMPNAAKITYLESSEEIDCMEVEVGL